MLAWRVTRRTSATTDQALVSVQFEVRAVRRVASVPPNVDEATCKLCGAVRKVAVEGTSRRKLPAYVCLLCDGRPKRRKKDVGQKADGGTPRK